MATKIWDEVLTSGEIAEYKTIVIDTAGKMLSFMDKYIMKNNPKMKKADGRRRSPIS